MKTDSIEIQMLRKLQTKLMGEYSVLAWVELLATDNNKNVNDN